MKKKILIAVDCSIYSSQSLDYLTKIFAQEQDVSFQIINCVTSGGGVIESSADQADSLIPECSNHGKNKGAGHDYLIKAREKLIRRGIAPERITIESVVSGYNFGATIQLTAQKNLVDAILIGRRGLGYLSKVLMGSVSEKLVEDCHEIPIWLIDGEIEAKNILVPVDGTLPSMLAADHLAHIIEGRSDLRIYLFHCNRLMHKRITCEPKDFYDHWDQDWCDKHLSDGKCLFEGPTQLLVEAGIPKEQIITLPTVMDLEEAHAILAHARKHDCGTIVIGRRGKGITKGILGGVSDRTAKHAQDVALWIVG
ncbi:MAG: universal stress protein [Desulfobulbaceae bacterium]|uniref:Universal stress protein n=1 Tax=Candidatus Desulfatifera sulfidica TaxID=2841691 RepID=A0A8J6N658_9BACT|nr:universal stress protein [Candidatus Desulfatifera sulfidica]